MTDPNQLLATIIRDIAIVLLPPDDDGTNQAMNITAMFAHIGMNLHQLPKRHRKRVIQMADEQYAASVATANRLAGEKSQ